MLDIAWPELIVIGAVALVAIGPKDLPRVMHKLGQWLGQLRRFGRDIQRGFDQLTYEAEVVERMRQQAPDSDQPTTHPAEPPSYNHDPRPPSRPPSP